MPWYAAHIIEARKRVDGIGNINIMENIHLIKSENPESALILAEKIRDNLNFQDATEEIDGVKSVKFGVHVRKLIAALEGLDSEELLNNNVLDSEITYQEYELESDKDLEDLISGQPVDVKFFD
jgi:hypothetical protein